MFGNMLPSGSQVLKAAALLAGVMIVFGLLKKYVPGIRDVPVLGLAFQ